MRYILGLSGGADSSYCLALAKQMSLDVLAVTVDAGWSTPEADHNIKVMTEKTKTPLVVLGINQTYLDEARRAFLLASTPHAETPADVAYQAILYRYAKSSGMTTIISGMNKLEGLMPLDWSVIDTRYIKSVWKQYARFPFPKDAPILSMLEYRDYKRMVWRILDDAETKYDPYKTKDYLRSVFGWKDYGGKHLEDRFTKFNQGVRFWKFGIDARVVNYKALVNYGFMTWDKYYETLCFAPYSHLEFRRLCDEVGKRLGLNMNEILLTPPRRWQEFKTWRYWIEIGKKYGLRSK